MASKTETERYGEWLERVTEREKSLKTLTDKWDVYLDHYRMDIDEADPDLAGDTVWLNYIFALSRTILPSIYYRNPEVIVDAIRDTPITYARIIELLLNFQLREINFEAEARRIVLDTLLCGIGVMKLGCRSLLDARGGSRKSEEEFSFFDESLWEDTEAEIESEKRGFSRLHPVLPFAIRISPKNFFIDPLATGLHDARWVCHAILKPVDQVKKSKLYRSVLTSGIEGTHTLDQERGLYQVTGGPGASDKNRRTNMIYDLVTLYEIWDLETNRLMVIDSWNMTRGERKFLRDDENPYEMQDFPFETLVFNADPESPYGVSDAETWFNASSALNLIRTMQYNHIKRFQRKYEITKGALDPDEIDKLTNPADGAIIQTNVSGGPAVHAIEDAPVSTDMYALGDILRNELTQISGVTETRRGAPDKVRTATEASIVEQQARIRDSDKLYLVETFVGNCAKKLLILDQVALPSNYVDFLVGSGAMALWRQEHEKLLRSSVSVRIRIGSSSFTSREVKAKLYLDFLNLTKDMVYPETGTPVVDSPEIVRRVAEVLGIERYEELILPRPPVMPPAALGGVPGQPEAGPASPVRAGTPSLGALMSRVQNLGVRRTPPNPTVAMGEGTTYAEGP